MYHSDHIRSERAERAALADLARAAGPDLRRRLGLRIEPVDGALVASASASPSSIVVNRTVGLGVERPADHETVRDIVERYRIAGVERYFIHLDPAAEPHELPAWLSKERLAASRAWAKFVRSPDPQPDVSSDLEVRRAGPDAAADFGRIAATAFGLDGGWAMALAGLVGLAEWRVYLSFDGDESAGCGAMRIHGGTAWFDWAATRPEHRRRGSQQAMLARRIADARELGCDLLVTATGVAVPGEPQPSYRNIERAGFRLDHIRANWEPAA
jgi:GNAT superfamily N-acetyltransferase